jgi:Ni/Fe-hydrogenase subunit HybB-like protein
MTPFDAVALPGSNNPDMTDHVSGIALRSKAFGWWRIAVVVPAALTSVLVGSILYLFYAGVGIWGIDWPVAWGFAIINYVWWIAIASGGTFISALFFLTRSEWRNSINRIAESMTLFGAACAGLYPICIWAGRGFSIGCSPTRTAWVCGRSFAARCCGISSPS